MSPVRFKSIGASPKIQHPSQKATAMANQPTLPSTSAKSSKPKIYQASPTNSTTSKKTNTPRTSESHLVKALQEVISGQRKLRAVLLLLVYRLVDSKAPKK